VTVGVVVVCALVAVGLADLGAANATLSAVARLVVPSRSAGDRALERQFDLLRDQLRAQVPPDHSIYLDHLDDPSNLWTQRIAEFAAMTRIYLVIDPTQADFAVTLVHDSSAPKGIRLVAKPSR
jgi:hypothetical protein